MSGEALAVVTASAASTVPPPPPPGEARVVRRIQPQDGPQTEFVACDADIAIVGGGAFGGKTFSLLLLDVEHIADPFFASVTFRRDTNQIRNPGGLWDEATALYSSLGARPLSNSLEQLFPSGAVSKFAHLEYDADVYAWDGSQIPLLKFDQLESFTESQFWYMLSRNRDPSGHIRPYCRATCNPNPDSWLKRFLAWWIDPTTGYAIPERSGVLRWMLRMGEDLVWADSREELWNRYSFPDLTYDDPRQPRPMSVTFIVARIWDNKIGLEKDPGYLSKLMNMPRHERERLLGDERLGGNWNVRASAGLLFRREWCPTVPVEPAEVEWVRGWDLAATKPNPTNPDPDWTVGVKLGKYRKANRFVISKVTRDRVGPNGVETMLRNTAEADGPDCQVRLRQDPGQAGKAQAKQLVGLLAGYPVKTSPVTGDKVTYFSPFSSQAEAGNVDLVAGLPEEFLRSLEGFPDALHDDDADAISTGFERFVVHAGGRNVIDFYKAQRAAADAAKKALLARTDVDVAPSSAHPGNGSNGGGNGSNGGNGSHDPAPIPTAPQGKFSSFAAAIAAGAVPQESRVEERLPPVLIPDPDRPGMFIQRFDLRGPGRGSKR